MENGRRALADRLVLDGRRERLRGPEGARHRVGFAVGCSVEWGSGFSMSRMARLFCARCGRMPTRPQQFACY